MCRWRTARNYLAGLVVGDGSLIEYKRTYNYYIEIYDADREFLEKVAKEMKTNLKVNVKVMTVKNRNYAKLRISNKWLFTQVKEAIKKRIEHPTKAFIRGIIDSEGTVYADKKGRVAFEVANTNKKVIDAVHKYLKKHKIHHTVTVHKGRGNRKTIYKVRIRGWNNVENLIKLISPKHPKVSLKFYKLIDAYRKP